MIFVPSDYAISQNVRYTLSSSRTLPLSLFTVSHNPLYLHFAHFRFSYETATSHKPRLKQEPQMFVHPVQGIETFYLQQILKNFEVFYFIVLYNLRKKH